jgi:hypothetical protein
MQCPDCESIRISKIARSGEGENYIWWYSTSVLTAKEQQFFSTESCKINYPFAA